MFPAIAELLRQANRVVLGKEREVRQAVACLVARGHLLIEDLPGVGKTTLAHALARLLGLHYQRIQFTSDLLPADIVGAGVSIFDQSANAFSFHPGPVFAQLVLADEVNRATPKTQSALLEAMEEEQVTVEGETRPLPEPFFVIATQNPGTQMGTYPLPESQLDRFLMRLSLGYPDPGAERELLRGKDRRELIAELRPVIGLEQLAAAQRAVGEVFVSDALLDGVQALLEQSRAGGRYRLGLSPRAGLALVRAARAWALLEGRDAVIPDDVQAVFASVAGHRLQPLDDHAEAVGVAGAESLLAEVAVP